jgi:GH35 family endo-1,4-beta-xylanase
MNTFYNFPQDTAIPVHSLKNLLKSVILCIIATPSILLANAPAPPPALSNPFGEEILDRCIFNAPDTLETDESIVKVSGQSFSRARRVEVSSTVAPSNTWDVQLFATNTEKINESDIIYVEFWVRGKSKKSESGEAVFDVVFEQNGPPYRTSLMMQITSGEEWNKISLPFVSVKSFEPRSAKFNLRLGYAAQWLEIGGLTITNHGAGVNLSSFPRTRATYVGRNMDAAWRAEALGRIDKLRKGNLSLKVIDSQGAAIQGATVLIEQTQHAFEFGTAVSPDHIFSQDETGQNYRKILTSGIFNSATLENHLGWAWENPKRREAALRAIEWLRVNGYKTRGHAVIWPSFRFAPKRLESIKDDPAQLKAAFNERIDDAMSAFAGKLSSWDVINEPFTQRDYLDILGDEIMADWIRRAHAVDPKTPLYLNDFAQLTNVGLSEHEKYLETLLKNLLKQGVPLQGVGIQAHIGGAPISPAEVLAELDRVSAIGLPIKITEFDVATTDEAMQADYTRDFYIAAFSHPAVNGITMWGFWEGRHWIPKAALMTKNWNPKPNYEAYRTLVRQEWWTRGTGATDKAGQWLGRGFKGDYSITIEVGAKKRTFQTSISDSQESITLKFD